MTHVDDDPSEVCLAVFAGDAVLAAFDYPGPSMSVQARRVRAALKREWPEQYFDVRVRGGRVSTCWTDGPDMSVVASVLSTCEAAAHRITWRRTEAGIMERKLNDLFVGRRQWPLPAQVGAGQARLDAARADAAKIVGLLRAFATSQSVGIKHVLAEFGLAMIASIVDVDLDLDLEFSTNREIATLLDADVLICKETRRALPPRPMV